MTIDEINHADEVLDAEEDLREDDDNDTFRFNPWSYTIEERMRGER